MSALKKHEYIILILVNIYTFKRKNRFSLIYNTSARHERHGSNKSNTSATQEQHD